VGSVKYPEESPKEESIKESLGKDCKNKRAITIFMAEVIKNGKIPT